MMKEAAIEESSREKLVRSGERLFSERGFNGASVRDIANDARVNPALVGYYFGGKEGLLAEIYTRHCEPLKSERARLLAMYRADGRSATLEEVLDSFIRPSLRAGQGPEKTFTRLRAILSAENSSLLEQLVAQTFDDTSRCFIDAVCECLPSVSRDDVFWRFHFLLGTIYYTATGPYRIRALSGGKCDPSKPEPTTEQLIAFAAAGFRAPRAKPLPRVGKTQTPAKRARGRQPNDA